MMQLSLDELGQLSQKIVENLPHGGVVILQGNLASGKTTFVQSFARFLGLQESVTSPTFSLQQCYGEGFFHYDIYNYGFEKFRALGMMDELERKGYHLIEWGDDALIELVAMAGFSYVIISITQQDENRRCYEVKNGQ